MSLIGEQVLLRLYLRSADRTPHTPTHERVLKSARQHGLAGATVIRGIMGLGAHGLMQASAWSVTEHVPVIVEIVDTAERIADFIAGPLDELMIGGMATLERAAVMMYRHRRDDSPNQLRLADLLPPRSTLPPIETGANMKTKTDGVLLRIFIGEDDRADGKPLYEAILHQARELGLSGATVLRGSAGFGAHSVVHKAKLLEMSTDLPIVIEIVDSEPNVAKLLPYLEDVVREGMVTMEYVTILLYREGAD